MLQNPEIIILFFFVLHMNAISDKIDVNHNQSINEQRVVSGNSEKSQDQKSHDDDWGWNRDPKLVFEVTEDIKDDG